MTSAGERDDRVDARRLSDALFQRDELSHADAEMLIAMLVEAESMGQDVDGDPTFTLLLRHLDHCADCLALYEETAEDNAATMALQLGRQTHVDVIARSPKRVREQSQEPVTRTFGFFLPTVRRGSQALIREQSPLYAAPPSAPLAEVEITEDEYGATLRVRVFADVSGASWLVEVTAEGFRAERRTDSAGVALFLGVPSEQTLRVVGREER